jgi:hypothetical protein
MDHQSMRLHHLIRMSDRHPYADEVGEIMQQVLVEANFPTANFEALDHGFRSFLHPAFMPAWDRVRSLTATGGDAFSMASGAYAAVLLAALVSLLHLSIWKRCGS